MNRTNLWRGAALCAALVALPAAPQAPAPAASPAPTLIPVKDYARKADYVSAKISPTGQYLAVAKWVDDIQGVAIIDLEAGKVSGVLAFTRGEMPIDYWWVGPKRLIAEVGNTHGPLDQPRSTGELYAMDADGRARKYLFGWRGTEQIGTRLSKATKTWDSAYVLNPMPDDPDHVAISVWSANRESDQQFPVIERIDVNNGRRSRVGFVPAFFPDVLTDQQGVPRFASGDDAKGHCCRVMAFPPGAKEWVDVKPTGEKPHWAHLFSLSRSGDAAYFASDADDGRSACVQEYKIDGGALRTLSCRERLEPEVELSPDDDRPIAIRYEDGKPQLEYPDPEASSARVLRALQKGFGEQRVSGVSASRDGSKMVMLVDGDRNPGEFFLFDRKARKASMLMGRRAWIDPNLSTRVEPISYSTRDGATIQGYLTAREGLKTRAAPLVLIPHGGPHQVRDTWKWDPDAQLLASRGYAVLQVNFRGSDGYGEAFRQSGWGRWGTRMIDDISDATRWAIAQGIADPARICIYGASYGGYAALTSAVREPELYRCAASLAGVYDLLAQKEDADTADSWIGRVYLDQVLGRDDKALAEQSPINHVQDLKAPVLIAHGTADKRAPFSQAKALRRALDKANKPYEWMEFEDEEHGLFKDADQEAFYNKLLAFLDQHIGAAAAPATTASAPN